MDCNKPDFDLFIYNTNNQSDSKQTKYNYKYDYTCTDVETMNCTTHNTEWTNEGQGNVAFLDKHNIKCPPNKGLKKMKYVRNPTNLSQTRYDYTCCDINDVKGDEEFIGLNSNISFNKEQNYNFVEDISKQNILNNTTSPIKKQVKIQEPKKIEEQKPTHLITSNNFDNYDIRLIEINPKLNPIHTELAVPGSTFKAQNQILPDKETSKIIDDIGTAAPIDTSMNLLIEPSQKNIVLQTTTPQTEKPKKPSYEMLLRKKQFELLDKRMDMQQQQNEIMMRRLEIENEKLKLIKDGKYYQQPVNSANYMNNINNIPQRGTQQKKQPNTSIIKNQQPKKISTEKPIKSTEKPTQIPKEISYEELRKNLLKDKNINKKKITESLKPIDENKYVKGYSYMSGWKVPIKRKPVCKPRPGTKCDNPCRLNTLQNTENNLIINETTNVPQEILTNVNDTNKPLQDELLRDRYYTTWDKDDLIDVPYCPPGVCGDCNDKTGLFIATYSDFDKAFDNKLLAPYTYISDSK